MRAVEEEGMGRKVREGREAGKKVSDVKRVGPQIDKSCRKRREEVSNSVRGMIEVRAEIGSSSINDSAVKAQTPAITRP